MLMPLPGNMDSADVSAVDLSSLSESGIDTASSEKILTLDLEEFLTPEATNHIKSMLQYETFFDSGTNVPNADNLTTYFIFLSDAYQLGILDHDSMVRNYSTAVNAMPALTAYFREFQQTMTNDNLHLLHRKVGARLLEGMLGAEDLGNDSLTLLDYLENLNVPTHTRMREMADYFQLAVDAGRMIADSDMPRWYTNVVTPKVIPYTSADAFVGYIEESSLTKITQPFPDLHAKQFIDILCAAKILNPDEFKNYPITLEMWEKMKAYVFSRQGKPVVYVNLLSKLQVIAADIVNVHNANYELNIYNLDVDEPNKTTSTLPARRSF